MTIVEAPVVAPVADLCLNQVPEPTYGERRTETQKQVDAHCVALVERGIAWLDANVGPSWVDKVDLSRLEMSSGDRCVLGQVFRNEGCREGISGYEYGTRVMRGSSYLAAHLPFHAFDGSVDLQEAWLQALAATQG